MCNQNCAGMFSNTFSQQMFLLYSCIFSFYSIYICLIVFKVLKVFKNVLIWFSVDFIWLKCVLSSQTVALYVYMCTCVWFCSPVLLSLPFYDREGVCMLVCTVHSLKSYDYVISERTYFYIRSITDSSKHQQLFSFFSVYVFLLLFIQFNQSFFSSFYLNLSISLSLFSVCLIILLFPNEIIRHWDILFIFLLNVFEDAFLYLFINSTFQTVCQTFPSSTSSWQSQDHSSDGARCFTRIASAMRSISPIPSLSLFHSLPLSFFLHSIAIAKWNINSIFFFLLCFLWLLAFSDFCTQFLLNMRWRYVFV